MVSYTLYTYTYSDSCGWVIKMQIKNIKSIEQT